MNKLHIKKEAWHEDAGYWLKAACDDLYTVDDLAGDVKEGHCSLFNVYEADALGNNDHIASFVLRIDGGPVREMVVVAGGGYLAHGSLYKLITPYVEEVARANRCTVLRGHTKRAGVGRLMEKAGWSQSEIVYRKGVSHGRQIIQ